MLRLAVLLLLVPVPAVAQSALPAAVDNAARAAMDSQKLVGLAVGVVVDGKIAYLQGYGLADREAQVKVDPKATQFRWASCSKSVTAIAALQLAESGKLDLDADVRRYVPEFPDKGVPLTSRQLLCHQAGIVHYLNGKVVRTERSYDTPHPFRDVVLALDRFKESPLVNKPGEKFSYTTHGYVLLSAVVERAGKQAFTEQVTDRIARPLGMTGFRPDYQWEAIPNRAVGYVKSKESIVPRRDADAPDVSWKLGGGGYTSTVEDFARFAAGLADHQLVSAKTETAMWTAQKTADGKPTTYGLGFTVGTTADGKPRVGHSGAQEKTRTAMLIEPEARRAVVVMTNSEYAFPGDIARQILAVVR